MNGSASAIWGCPVDHDLGHGDDSAELLILIAGGSAISITNASLDWLGSTHVLTISVSIILWAIVAAVCLFWLHGTRSGSLIFAIGANPVVSRLSGVPIRRLTLATYVISGFCAGLAGLLLLSMNGQGYVGISDPTYCRRSRRWCSAAPRSWRTSAYLGTIAGAVLLVSMTALITIVNASEGWRSVVLGCLILAGCHCLVAISPAECARDRR